MFKWFKKHCKKLIIASSILTACICGLFGFTRSYAYDYNDNNNTLVGNNLLDNYSNAYVNVYVGNVLNTSITANYNNGWCEVSGLNNLTSTVSIDLCFDNTNITFDNYKCVGFLIENNLTYNSNIYNYIYTSHNSTYIRGEFMTANTKQYFTCFNVGNNAYNNTFILNIAIFGNWYINGSIKFKPFIFDYGFNGNYFINNNNTFVPYDSIEQLQEAYDTLQQQYNDYVASHSYTNTQYNDLVANNSSLQQQLATLQLQYDTYVASHSHTNEEYDEIRQHLSSLQENYSDLHDELLELQNDYEDLQNAYNTMKTNYDTLNSSINYGIFAYIEGYNYGDILYGGVEFYGSYDNTSYRILPPHYDSNLPGNSSYMWTFDELIEEGLLENGGILRIDKITDRSDYNSNVNYNCHIALNHMPITSFYLDVQGMNGAYIQVKDYNSQPRTVSFTTNSIDHTFTYQNIYSVDSQFGNEISDIYITPQFTSSSILGQAIGATASIQSYNNGYNDGVNFMSYYKNEYDIISREYDSARRDIATLRELNESLNEQISSNLGWKSLFFAMADTPLKTVSNVLGFELFGVNLFTTFIGMLTVLGIVFLLKKLI